MRMCCQLVIEFTGLTDEGDLSIRPYIVDRDGTPCQEFPADTVRAGSVLTFGPCYVECDSQARLIVGTASSGDDSRSYGTAAATKSPPKPPQPESPPKPPQPESPPKPPQQPKRGSGPDLEEQDHPHQSAAEEALFGKNKPKGGDPRK